MIKVSYRNHKGRRFKRTVTHLTRVKIPLSPITATWRHPETLVGPSTIHWAQARNIVTWAIWSNGDWRYCFANINMQKGKLKMWLDYFAKRYEDKP